MTASGITAYLKRYGLVMTGCWSVIVLVLAAATLHYHRRDILAGAESEARDYFRLNLFYRAWAARMGGVYVPVDRAAPNPYLAVPQRDVTTTEGRRLTLINPAYMTRMVFESMINESPEALSSRLVSLKPLNPVNTPDEWERRSLEAFERREGTERSEVTTISGKPYLRLISMFSADEPCLKCHAHQGYRKGDVRGAITISVPLAKRYRLGQETERRIIGGYALLWLVGTSGITVAARRRFSAEERLRESERKFRTLCDWTQDWEYWVAPDRSLYYVSPSCVEITGYTAEEFITDPGLIRRIVHPGHYDDFCTHQHSVMTNSHSITEIMEFRIITRSGTIRWIQHCCRSIWEGSTYLGRRTSNRDITEQKQATERLSHLSAIVQSSDDAIISKTTDGLVTSWNQGAEALFGYSEQEMLGRPLSIIFPPEALQEEQEILAALSRGERVEHFDTIRMHKDGHTVDVSVAISPIRDHHGTVIGISSVARDITERKRVAEEHLQFERQMMQTQKLESLGVLAGGIAHDFNNILMAIIGNTDLALMRLTKESPATDNLRQVLDAATRAADLARQMLAYSGKGKFLIEPIDLNRLVHEMTHMLEVSISKKALLTFKLYEPLPVVSADATQLRQVIMNLVINASEAIGDKSGIIAISTGCMNCDRRYLQDLSLDRQIPDGRYVYLEIADTGCGMDRETIARLFDPFFTTKFTGRGLGMSAVQGIIRGHQGAIKVYSEPGKGTTFKVLLPASAVPQEISGSTETDTHWCGSGTVLLIDDEQSVREIGGEMLRELGFDVIAAANGQVGIEVFEQHHDRIDLVILDLTMPHLDGEQTFRELRQRRPDIKVIISSGFNEQEVTQKFLGKELTGFIQKPYKLSTLKEILRKILDDEGRSA
jgi:PAS domain S-box-containing protein